LNAVSKDSSREISLLEIEQTYGLSGNLGASPLYIIGNGDSQVPGKRFSDIHTRLTLYPARALLVTQETYIDPYSGGVKILRNSLGIVQPKFSTLITHTYQAGDINQVLWLSNATYKDFDGRISILYDLRESSWISTLYAITYHPKCWSITLTLIQERRPPDTSIHFSFNLSGITGNAQPAVPSSPSTGPTPPVPASVRGSYGLQERVF
jgi:hypothetical protein